MASPVQRDLPVPWDRKDLPVPRDRKDPLDPLPGSPRMDDPRFLREQHEPERKR